MCYTTSQCIWYPKLWNRAGERTADLRFCDGLYDADPCFDQLRGTDAYRVVGTLENSDRIMRDTFWVGVYPGMTDKMIDYMVKTIREAVNM